MEGYVRVSEWVRVVHVLGIEDHTVVWKKDGGVIACNGLC